MKFILTQDWIHESTFLGKKTTKKIYEKGHIFEPENGVYKIMDTTGKIFELNETEMKSFDIFEEYKDPENDFEIIIEEVPDDDNILVRNWRIQLDVKTTRKQLKEFEKRFRESLKDII